MLNRPTLIFAAAMLCLAAPASARKKGKKREGGASHRAAIIPQFDKDGNQQLEGDEADVLKATFAVATPGTAGQNLAPHTDGWFAEDGVAALSAKNVSNAAKP